MIKFKETIIAFFLMLWMSNISYSQPNKNSFYVYYTPQLTKTNFNQILINNPVFFKEFYETAAPDKPLGGQSFGIGYIRKISKFSLGFYLQKNIRGQKTDFTYNYRRLIPADTSDTFGGLYYTFQMESVSFGLTAERQIISKPKFYLALQIGLGLDVYETAYLKDYTINVQTGDLSRGCCFMEYSHLDKGGISNFIEHFKEGFYRGELSLTLKSLIELTECVNIEISPQTFILSKILIDSKSLDHTVPKGRISSLGVKFGIHYHF